MKEIAKYSGCFVCGDSNDRGLKAKFYFDGEKAITEVIADKLLEGYHDIYHGGILSTLLDEVMIKSILAIDRYAVTAEMTVRFLRPVRTGDRISLTGWVTKHKGRIFLTKGQATGSDNSLFATATGKYIEADRQMKSLLMNSID